MEEESKKENFILVQKPNLPLILAFIFWLSDLFIDQENISVVFRAAFLSLLILWAILEIKDGANWFRRLLGTAVLLYFVAQFVFS